MNFKSLFLVGSLLLLSQDIFSQKDTSKVNKKRVFIVGSSLGATLGGSYWYIQNSWWSEKQIPFHFDNGADLTYASNVDKALNISTTVITLIEELWPSESQKSSITLSLIEGNLEKEEVTFGYIRDGGADPVLTLGYGKRQGYFVDRSFSSALNEFYDEQLDVWRGSIKK